VQFVASVASRPAMGRSPCCDENGLKKGPWTQEEDEKLLHYIQKNGHGSWRTLPRLAGTRIHSLLHHIDRLAHINQMIDHRASDGAEQ
jgi:hypothetical protein